MYVYIYIYITYALSSLSLVRVVFAGSHCCVTIIECWTIDAVRDIAGCVGVVCVGVWVWV